MKNSGSFHISTQNIDYVYSLEPPQRGGSNEYLQSMFLSRNKKINAYPCKPQFYCIKLGFKRVKTIYRRDFVMEMVTSCSLYTIYEIYRKNKSYHSESATVALSSKNISEMPC